ncbi:MAG: ammonium transporter [Proteobacteria bacterium]|nr:MAG: ammonium transporter [Pseudomonadota bacterium]
MNIFINSFWVALSAILVLLMNFGLGFFYSGLVSGRNAVNTIKMSIVTLGVVPILWWAVGYSLSFSGSGAFVGDLQEAFFNHIGINDVVSGTHFLTLSFICFQAMFASIAPAIISGSGVERLRYSSYLIFIILWVLLVYCTLAHTVWSSNGWGMHFGAFDFAGGIVVHAGAGFSGLALAMVLKPRKSNAYTHGKHNLPLMVLGCGLLWFGWFGFNAGSALELSSLTILAFANTLFATSSAMVMWVLCEYLTNKPRTITGLCNALIIGLVAITPSAGYVTISSAVAIGAIVSFLSYFITIWYNRYKHKLDDSLDVFTCHGIPGFLGGILVGVFACSSVNPAVPNGLIYGSSSLLGKQVIVTVLGAGFSFFATYLILLVMSRTIGIRVQEDHEEHGLDVASGEKAYN